MANAGSIITSLREAAAEGNPVSVEMILDHFDRRSLGALIMVPALLEITPIGGIPGLPTFLALIIALFAAQIAMGREDMWLPGFITRRKVDCRKIDAAADKLAPAARWADDHFGQHLDFLIRAPWPRFAALAVLSLCVTVPPLELIPFASTLPMVTIAAFGLALLMHDGRLMALAWAVYVAALGGIVWFVVRHLAS